MSHLPASAPTSEPRRIVLAIPLPPRALGGNSRVHFGERARATKEYQKDVLPAIVAARPKVPLRLPVTISYHFYCHQFRVRGKRIKDGRYRPLDDDNAIRSMKAFVDALVIHQLVPTDKHRDVRIGEVKITPHSEAEGRMGVAVFITEAAEE